MNFAPLTTVEIDATDIENGFSVFAHFDIEVPIFLKEAGDAFLANPTLENQNIYRLTLCRAIVECDHPFFKEDLFTSIRENCQKVLDENSAK